MFSRYLIIPANSNYGALCYHGTDPLPGPSLKWGGSNIFSDVMITSLILFALSFSPWSRALQYYGADFSSLVNLENSGLVYNDANSPYDANFETILRNNGANLARIRIWTSALDSEYSLNYGLALAKRASAAGMEIYVDLHYSDTCKFYLRYCSPGNFLT